MKPAAQIQAAIELLDVIIEEKRPADRLMAQYFRDHRYIGSKDKLAISTWVYLALRQYASLVWRAEQCNLTPTARRIFLVAAKLAQQPIKEWFSGEQYCPRELDQNERHALPKIPGVDMTEAPLWVQLNIPEWLMPQLQASLGERFQTEMQVLQEQASVDIRCNLLKASREQVKTELLAQGMEAVETSVSPWGLRFDKRHALFNQNAFKQGWFEMQDEGSQLLALVTQVQPGDKVVDFCAGAGGKTLAMGAMMQNKGVVHACDVHSKRLENLSKRAKRAGVHNIQVHLMSSERDKWVKRQVGRMDVVLIDAPCTGTGTWRRSPDAKWNLQAEDVQNLQTLQHAILESAARLVKPGGKLFYATCSLLQEENEQQIERFLSENKEFAIMPIELDAAHSSRYELAGHQLRTYPAQSEMDGFFVAAMQRQPAE